MSFSFGLQSDISDNDDVTHLIVITDAGQDCDDEVALLMMVEFIKMKVVSPYVTIVANLYPAPDRARLVEGAMKTLFEKNAKYLPGNISSTALVATGTDGGDKQGKHKSAFLETGKNYVSPKEVANNGYETILQAYKEADKLSSKRPQRITILCISSMTDIAEFASKNVELFGRNTKEVVMMGGGVVVEGKLAPEKDAHNNAFDFSASTTIFNICQEQKVPMIIFSRHATLSIQFPPSLYDELAATGNPVAIRLRDTQKYDLDLLWRRSIATTEEGRQGLPARCDRAWYLKTFCGGEDIVVNDDAIWNSVKKLSISDLAAMVAAIPSYRSLFFNSVDVVVDGVTHKLIGTGPDNRCVVDPDGYINFATKALISACSGGEPTTQQPLKRLGSKKKSFIPFIGKF